MVVEKPVGYEPRAVAEIGEELLGRAVGEVAAGTVERKEIQQDGDYHHERQDGEDGERERAALHRDRCLVERLILAHLRHGEKPPVRHEIGGGERGERARHHGEKPVGAHERRWGERRRDGKNRHEAHRDVVYPL